MTHKNKNDRVVLELRIMSYRSLIGRVVHNETKQRLMKEIAELERKLREIDE
jgi:hypothetical protein